MIDSTKASFPAYLQSMGGAAIKRLASFVVVAGGWILAGVRTALDLIGWSTAPDDVTVAASRLDQFLIWLLALPWWLPWGFATFATGWLMWVSWPRTGISSDHGSVPIQIAPPRTTPQELTARMAVPANTKQKRVLTPHEAERKIKAIDNALDRLNDMASLIETAQSLRRQLDSMEQSQRNAYLDELQKLLDALNKFTTDIQQFRLSNPEHEDIIEALRQSDLNQNPDRVAAYRKACRSLVQILKDAPLTSDLKYLFSPFVQQYELAINDLRKWLAETRVRLVGLRNQAISN